jgi:hypothetical protein
MARVDDGQDVGTETEWPTVGQQAYDREGSRDLTTVIIETIADVEGVDPMAVTLPPLYDVVDTAAIEDNFFGQKMDENSRESVGRIDFHYRDFRVTVTSDGWVMVAESVRTSQTDQSQYAGGSQRD